MFKGGFSLVEMLVVISLIFIVAAITYPSLARMQENGLARQDATRVADLIQQAQEKSVSEQQIYGVQLDGTPQLITYGDSFNPSQTATVVRQVTLGPAITVTQNTIWDAPSSSSSIRFTAAGLPSTTGYLTIANSHDASHTTWKITVTPAGSTQLSQ